MRHWGNHYLLLQTLPLQQFNFLLKTFVVADNREAFLAKRFPALDHNFQKYFLTTKVDDGRLNPYLKIFLFLGFLINLLCLFNYLPEEKLLCFEGLIRKVNRFNFHHAKRLLFCFDNVRSRFCKLSCKRLLFCLAFDYLSEMFRFGMKLSQKLEILYFKLVSFFKVHHFLLLTKRLHASINTEYPIENRILVYHSKVTFKDENPIMKFIN